MEYNEYKPLRDERKLILAKIKNGNTSQQLIDRLDVITKVLKKDPPTLAALYGCVGES